VAYAVSIASSALRALQKLPADAQRRIRAKIDELANEPRPAGAKALQGAEAGYLRIRIGDYRVIYAVEDRQLLVLVVRIADRKEAYRR
jgi:mRNA interferase RelE/StbE